MNYVKFIILFTILMSNGLTKEVSYCNFDTGKLETDVVVKLEIVPAIDNVNESLILESGLVIRQDEVIETIFKTNCI